MTGQDVEAQVEWGDWLSLDAMAPVLALVTEQSYDELSGTLVHLQDLDLLQLGREDNGGLWFRIRADQAGRRLALRLALADCHAYASRN